MSISKNSNIFSRARCSLLRFTTGKNCRDMSGLSNRVKSMKFMNRAESSVSSNADEAPRKNDYPQAEWSLPKAAEIKAKSKDHSVVEAVGFGSISAFEHSDDESAPQGRKVWGDIKQEKPGVDLRRIKDSRNEDKQEDENKVEEEPEISKTKSKRKSSSDRKKTKKSKKS